MKSIILLILSIGLVTFSIDAQQFLGTTGSTGQIYRNGTIKLGTTGKGFVTASGDTDSDSEWGGHWYGMSRGNPSLMNLGTSSAGDPVAINGYTGIGFKTASGRVAILQNGIVTIGLPKSKITQLKDVTSGSLIYKLYVGGGIRTEDVFVDLQSNWADYVFDEKYNLMPLADLKKFIVTNKHLPNIPSSTEIAEAGGFNLKEITIKQQEKIEELTLYVLDLFERLNKIESDQSTANNN